VMDWLRGQVTTVLRNISPRTRVALSLTGVAAGALLAYALYFDYRRRTAGDYKEKLRARRKLTESRRDLHPGTSQPSPSKESPMRILPVDPTGMQHFFLQEVQLGEEMLMEGHVDEGIDHLAMAILMCNKPDQVMGVFRQTLAEGHYALLERAVPKARRKFAQLMAHSRHEEEGEEAGGDGNLYEDDG